LKILEFFVNLYFNQKTYDFKYPLFKSSNSNIKILTIPGKKKYDYSNNAEKLVRETEKIYN
jgi:hypothetical protein